MTKNNPLLASKANLKIAEKYLAKADPKLGELINRHGPCLLEAHQDYYGALVRSIVGQQLSVKAAAVILARFKALFGDKLPTPEQIIEKPGEEIRAVGFSWSKVKYINDLADKLISGELKLDKIKDQTNEQIIEELTSIKGIGVWTAHMFLIFCVGRLDVLPVGDLGIKKGVMNLNSLKQLPTEEKIAEIAKRNHWAPYESVASWYIWRSLDNQPA